jgi:urease accessory protein
MNKMIAGSFAVLGIAAMTFGHPGHSGDTGLVAGAVHPLVGIDHLIAALAVGFWAVRLGGSSRWMIPSVFVGTLFAAVLVPHGISAGAAESGITASLFVLGLFAIFGMRLPVAPGIGITALFAMFHGAAHASETPANVSALGYAIGLTTTTAIVCVFGGAIAMLIGLRSRIASAAA